MYKDSPYEGFTWRKYFRSTALSALIAVAWQAAAGFELGAAWARLVLFGLTYVTERGLVELYKTYLREEDQSKYFIPMQFHVMGRVVHSRAVRWSVAAGWIVVVLGVGWGLRWLQGSGTGIRGWLAVVLIGSVGGWLSAFGGAFKDAPIEGFETFKFFRSPAVAASWAFVVSLFTSSWTAIAIAAEGFTVASIETYKTFFFPNKPRGKFAGMPIRFPHFLRWRYRFAPLYAAIWAAIVVHLAIAFAQPRQGVVGGPAAPEASAARTAAAR